MNDNINYNWRDEYENESRSPDYDWLKDLNQVTKFHQRNIGHDHLFLVEEDKELKLKHDVDLNANITGAGFKYTDVREKRKEERAGARGEKSKLEKLGAAIATSKPKLDKSELMRGRGRKIGREDLQDKAARGEKSKLEKLGAAIATSKPKLDKSELMRGRGRKIGREDLQDKAVGGEIPRMVSRHLGTSHKLYQGERDVGGSGGSGKTSSTEEMWNPYDEDEDDEICKKFEKAKLDNQHGSYRGLWE